MSWLNRMRYLISIVLSVTLFGLLITSGLEGAIAQGSFMSNNKESVAISGTDLPNETLTLASTVENTLERPSSTITLPESITVQENTSILTSADTSKGIELFLQEEQSNSVTDNVYLLQTNDSRRTTLNVLAAAEQLRRKKQQLPNADAVRELPEKRTVNSKNYFMKDGSYQAIVSSGIEHFEDENGEMQDIIPFLISDANLDLFAGKISKESANDINLSRSMNKLQQQDRSIPDKHSYYRAPQVPFDLKISDNFAGGYSLSYKEETLKFVPVSSNSVVGSVYELNKIMFSNAWNQTDVLLSVNNDNLKEEIIVHNAQGPTVFTYEVTGSTIDLSSLKNLSIRPMWLVDSNGTFRDVDSSIRTDGAKTYLDISYNPDSLQFPITIDPTINIQPNDVQGQDTYYSSGSYKGDEDIIKISQVENNIGFIRFDLSAIPSNATIQNVDLSLHVYYAFLESTGVYVHTVTSPWDEKYVRSFIPSYLSEYLDYKPINNSDSNTRISLNVTNAVNQWRLGIRENYGFALKALLNPTIFYSSDSMNQSVRPKLIVNFSTPPVSPNIVYPNGSNIIDAVHQVTWQPATDAYIPQSNLKYQIQFSNDNGTSWTDLINLSSAGQTSASIDFSAFNPTQSALIRVRAFNGILYGPWDQSDAPFTIQHNRAPNTPSGLNPGSTSSTSPTLITGVTPTLNWVFSDPDAGDTQSAYNVLLYNSSNGLVRDFGWVTSSAKSFSVPNDILVRGTTYYWKVLVKDSKGAASSASSAMYIKANSLPVVNLTSYTNGQTIPDNILLFTWTFTDGDGQAQSAVQIQGSKDNFATIAYSSGTINGTATSFTTPALASGTWSFRVMASDGVEWSAYSQRTGLSLPNTFEPNDTTATATPASYGTYATLINSTTDVDFFKYTASTAGVNRVQLTPPAGKNYDVYVYDSSNTLLAAGVRGAGVSENIIYEVAAGGTYYVKIVGVNGEYSTTATYSLTIANVNFKTQTTYDYDSNGNLKTKTTSVIP